MDTKQFGEAEKVYRAALDKSPRLPRALAGLRDSLQAQNRLYEAQQIEQQLNKAAITGGDTSEKLHYRGRDVVAGRVEAGF
jgi:uncharacterized protein HemY